MLDFFSFEILQEHLHMPASLLYWYCALPHFSRDICTQEYHTEAWPDINFWRDHQQKKSSLLSWSSRWKAERRRQYFCWQCLLLANFFCIFWKSQKSQSKTRVDLWKIHTWLHILKGIKTSFDHKILWVLEAELCTLSSYFYNEWSFDNNHHQFFQNHYLSLCCIYLICNLKIASN